MELDVTHNPQLVTLDIGDTKVKTLDISKNPNLKTTIMLYDKYS